MEIYSQATTRPSEVSFVAPDDGDNDAVTEKVERNLRPLSGITTKLTNNNTAKRRGNGKQGPKTNSNKVRTNNRKKKTYAGAKGGKATAIVTPDRPQKKSRTTERTSKRKMNATKT
jgi:hypothetical protein